MIPSTRDRVRKHTPQRINREIEQQIAKRVQDLASNPGLIDTRLQELDAEWDIERAIELNASALALTGVVLGATADRRFLILPALVTGFLLQHAIQGWCPPVPILRRMGFRTAQEIEKERYALKAVRGDTDPFIAPRSSGASERAPISKRKSAKRTGGARAVAQ
jgi:hypothetical protein